MNLTLRKFLNKTKYEHLSVAMPKITEFYNIREHSATKKAPNAFGEADFPAQIVKSAPTPRAVERFDAKAARAAAGPGPPPRPLREWCKVRGLLLCANAACARNGLFVDRDHNAALNILCAFRAADLGLELAPHMRRTPEARAAHKAAAAEAGPTAPHLLRPPLDGGRAADVEGGGWGRHEARDARGRAAAGGAVPAHAHGARAPSFAEQPRRHEGAPRRGGRRARPTPLSPALPLRGSLLVQRESLEARERESRGRVKVSRRRISRVLP